MHKLLYIGLALWGAVGVVLFVWGAVLGALMMNNRLPPKPGESMFRVQPSFLTHDNPAAEYNERGQRYRKKAIRLQFIFIAYMISWFVLVTKVLWA